MTCPASVKVDLAKETKQECEISLNETEGIKKERRNIEITNNKT